jgi:hypothetical protein
MIGTSLSSILTTSLAQVTHLSFKCGGVQPYFAVNIRAFWNKMRARITPNIFEWEHVKSLVYMNHPRSLDEPRDCAAIVVEVLRNALSRYLVRLHKCLKVNGLQFDHQL